jgi:hypothetical protein
MLSFILSLQSEQKRGHSLRNSWQFDANAAKFGSDILTRQLMRELIDTRENEGSAEGKIESLGLMSNHGINSGKSISSRYI